MTEEGKQNLKAAWTPERRAAQAKRMRDRRRKAKGKPLGRRKGKARRAVAAPRAKSARKGSLGPQAEAILYLGQACALLQADYREGRSVGDSDPLVFLAYRALTRRTPS